MKQENKNIEKVLKKYDIESSKKDKITVGMLYEVIRKAKQQERKRIIEVLKQKLHNILIEYGENGNLDYKEGFVDAIDKFNEAINKIKNNE